MTFRKKAKAVQETREHDRFPFRIRLMGPDDGSGCMPAGEYPQHYTRWRSTLLKAVKEAIEYTDARRIKITEFPEGHGY